MHSPIQAVIFDHDGTLVDSEPVHLACWRTVLAPHEVTLSTEDYRQNLSGIPSIESATWLAGKFNLDIAADALLREKQIHLRNFLTKDRFPLMPDIKALLQYLREQNIALAVASGASREEVHASLRHHELTHYFDAVASKDDVRRNKPAPDVYQLAAVRVGVDANHCIAVEDSDTGEQAARAAGMHCLRYNPQGLGYKPLTMEPYKHHFPCYTSMQEWFAQRLPTQ